MTTELHKLRQKRVKWVEANRENGFDEGINRLLTELYPDNAHFIYELLQNAEDPQATEVAFQLSNTEIKFEHNGKRLFTIKDVESITSIGNSTKRDDPTTIGKFGVGFKAVFAYTNTPEIHSGGFHFRIHDLVVPETIKNNGENTDQKTRFTFPFDNPKKPAETAVKEIEVGLNNLGNNTLLFLSHIRKIKYTLPDDSTGSLRRINHDDGRIEIHAKHPGSEETVSYWLHFQKEVEVVDDDGKPKTCNVAIAFRLEEELNKKTEELTWKIVPLQHGQVSIFFPAEKETSNLRFHLHAPFASTVARDSVRDCNANHQLRDRIADLVVESLITIRDQRLLNVSFLAVLPNPADNLAGNAPFYEPIRKAIVRAFQEELLTPMKKAELYAKAKYIFKGPANISDVIDDDDLVYILNDDYEAPMWVANPPQRNQREDKFLESLEITEWGWSELVETLTFQGEEYPNRIETWLQRKSDTWLMRFYSLLGEACDVHNEFAEVGDLSIVRVSTEKGNKEVKPSEAYFPLDGEQAIADVLLVKPQVYATGRSESQKKFARSFLEMAGVRIYDARASIQKRLELYKNPLKQIEDTHYEDLKLFICYWKNHPLEKNLYTNQKFLIGSPDVNKNIYWVKPEQLCLDKPFHKTDLAEFYNVHGKYPVWKEYRSKFSKDQLNDFVDFLKAIGVFHKLDVISLSEEEAKKNPNNPYKWSNWTRTAYVHDYSIPGLEKYLALKNISASRLLWNALINASSSCKTASFRPNQQHSSKTVESQLVYYLKYHAWIPNHEGKFCKPKELTRETLHSDFPFNDSNNLLTAIEFGKDEKDRIEALRLKEMRANLAYQEKSKIAKNNGFDTPEEMEEAAALAQELKKQGKSFSELRNELTKNNNPELPEESVPNPERRRKGVLGLSENAPSKESVIRERSIQPGINDISARAKVYLRAKYTNTNGETICQCCQQEMPFKICDAYYFEAVQCIKKITNHLIENRLALCPTCAAMYQHARKTDDIEIQRLIVNHISPDEASSVEITVTLAGRQRNLRFVGTHWFDLKTIIANKINT